MDSRVPLAVLRQLAENGTADRATTVAMVSGADERDLTTALENLLDDGSIEAATTGSESLLELAERGQLRLTSLGRLRVEEADF